MKRLSVCQGT